MIPQHIDATLTLQHGHHKSARATGEILIEPPGTVLFDDAIMATQSSEQTVSSTSTSEQTSQDISATYTALHAYPFDNDTDYLSGLASILGHPNATPTNEELNSPSNADLILQVRCYYFARKHNLPPIDPASYSQWLARNYSSHAPTGTEAASYNGAAPSASTASPPDQQPPPPYPTSFAEIVDLITRNVPVPGIEDVPDTVLEHGSSKVDHTPRRKKPWESDGGMDIGSIAALSSSSAGDVETASTAAATVPNATSLEAQEQVAVHGNSEHVQPTINGNLTTGEGVVKILQPNAIPDSGLLAKD